VRTVPADTNVLRGDVLRRVRRLQEAPGRMMTAALGGGLRVLTPRHVPDEMDEHIREFAAKGRVDPELAERVWRNEYRPALTVVDVTDFLDELAWHPHVAATLTADPDDAPTAVLAVLLGQPVFSEDPDLAAVATGREWLHHLIAVTDAVLSDETLALTAWGTAKTVGATIRAGRSAYDRLERTVGPTAATLLALAIGGAIAWALVNRSTRQAILGSPPVQFAGQLTLAAAEHLGPLVTRGQAGESFLVAARLVDDPHLPPAAALFRLLAHARRPLTTDEISSELRWDTGLVERLLDNHAAFVPVDDTWQLGRRFPSPAPAQGRLRPRTTSRTIRAWSPNPAPPTFFPSSPLGVPTDWLHPGRLPGVRAAPSSSPPGGWPQPPQTIPYGSEAE